MGTKNNPGRYDCYQNAEPDEPMFILLARDRSAPVVVRRWAEIREYEIDRGRKPECDRAMVEEARQCADAMERWRVSRKGSKSPPRVCGEEEDGA